MQWLAATTAVMVHMICLQLLNSHADYLLTPEFIIAIASIANILFAH